MVIVEAGREGESVGKRGGCRNVISDLAGTVETHSYSMDNNSENSCRERPDWHGLRMVQIGSLLAKVRNHFRGSRTEVGMRRNN